jgi:hypothetical protein
MRCIRWSVVSLKGSLQVEGYSPTQRVKVQRLTSDRAWFAQIVLLSEACHLPAVNI